MRCYDMMVLCVTRPRKTRHVTPAPAAAAAPRRGALWVLATPRGWAGAASRSAELVLVARFYSGRGRARGCWHVWSVVRVPAQSAAAGACVNTVHQPGTATVASLDVTSTSRNHGRESQESWSSAAGVRTETSYGETAGRAAAALRAPCPVYTVLTVPSRAAASESPSPPQQQHRLQ